MTNKQEFGRPLSEAQRQHLTQLIANMRVARARLDAASTIMQAQVEAAQKEFDDAQGTANAFLRYCGNEHKVTFDDGQWGFDENLMCFVRNMPHPEGTLPPHLPVPEQAGTNGTIEHAANLT